MSREPADPISPRDEMSTPVSDDSSFTACLNRHLRRSGLSLTALARRSWLDISYCSRLVHLPCDPLNSRHGDRREKRHPSLVFRTCAFYWERED